VVGLSAAVLGIMAPAAVWALWSQRARVGWVLPLGALVLELATIYALANGAVAP
jgi:hypothetical protein